MKIMNRNANELLPYERNAKRHDQKQIENVANSIRRFGWQQPIVIDDNDVVVIGHCRLLAAKYLGLEQVPCTVASGLTEDEVKELRIMDNLTNESPWDLEIREMELSELDLDGFDFDIGKDESGVDLDAFFTEAEQKTKEPKQIQCPHCGEWFKK